jgi:hypothetical protein
MLITKRVERLYSLAQFENIKIVYEAQEEIGDKDPNKEYERISELLYAQIKKDAELIKPKKKEEELD